MKIELYHRFIIQLNAQVDFIARDKPSAARRFKTGILKQVYALGSKPFANRNSIYFPQSEKHRDLVYKGYKVIYRVEVDIDTVFIIGLVNMQQGSAEE